MNKNSKQKLKILKQINLNKMKYNNNHNSNLYKISKININNKYMNKLKYSKINLITI